MSTLPVRPVPTFAATWRDTAPFPEPLAPAATTIQGTVLEAAHVQPAGAVTFTVTDSAAEESEAAAGAMAAPHPGTDWPACDTVTGLPAMAITPLLAGPGFAPTLTTSSVDPVPETGDVTLIQDSLETAVQEQKSCVVTTICAVPPPTPSDRAGGDTDASHAAASCVIATRCPLTAIPPRRGTVLRLPATENGSVPGPWPEAVPDNVSHETSDVAVH